MWHFFSDSASLQSFQLPSLIISLNKGDYHIENIEFWYNLKIFHEINDAKRPFDNFQRDLVKSLHNWVRQKIGCSVEARFVYQDFGFQKKV